MLLQLKRTPFIDIALSLSKNDQYRQYKI